MGFWIGNSHLQYLCFFTLMEFIIWCLLKHTSSRKTGLKNRLTKCITLKYKAQVGCPSIISLFQKISEQIYSQCFSAGEQWAVLIGGLVHKWEYMWDWQPFWCGISNNGGVLWDHHDEDEAEPEGTAFELPVDLHFNLPMVMSLS